MTAPKITAGEAAFRQHLLGTTDPEPPSLQAWKATSGPVRRRWEKIAEVGAEALTAERDEAREQLATCRERNAAIAVQLDQYRDERDAALDQRDRYRGALAEISGQCGCADEQCPSSIARKALGVAP